MAMINSQTMNYFSLIEMNVKNVGKLTARTGAVFTCHWAEKDNVDNSTSDRSELVATLQGEFRHVRQYKID